MTSPDTIRPGHNPALVALLAQLPEADRIDAFAILAEMGAELPPRPFPFKNNSEAARLAERRRRSFRGRHDTITRGLVLRGVRERIAKVTAEFIWRLFDGEQWVARSIPDWCADLGITSDTFCQARDVAREVQAIDYQDQGGDLPCLYRLFPDVVRDLELAEMRHAEKQALERAGKPYTGLRKRIVRSYPENSSMTLQDCKTIPEISREIPGKTGVCLIEENSLKNPPTPQPELDASGRSFSDSEKEDDEPPETVRMLAAACSDKGVSCDAKALRTFCDLVDVTPAEAHAAAQSLHDTTSAIGDGAKWLRAVILKKRSQQPAKTQATPVGVHASHTQNDTLARMDAFDREDRARRQRLAEGKPDDPAALAAIAELRGKLKYANRKG
jgi:hypothetical protein